MSSEKKVLIYGGKGGLGTVLVSHFKSNGWTVISVDLAANDVADANVLVNPNDDWAKQVLIPNDKTLKFIKIAFKKISVPKNHAQKNSLSSS